jgi:5-(carboxyamino)imidazole ribonucleotide mutase
MTKKPAKSTTAAGHIADNATSPNTAALSSKPLVGIIMGSSSDWETMEHAVKTLTDLGVPHETQVVSAHRTPDLLFEYASTAEQRGLEVLIAGAGGAAHLPGMTASKTVLPVLGVPVESKALKGLDSLLSIAQMPGGIPVGTLAIGKAGAINSALLAAAILGAKYPSIREALRKFRVEQTERVLANPDPSLAQTSSFRLTPPESSTDTVDESPSAQATTAKRKPA